MWLHRIAPVTLGAAWLFFGSAKMASGGIARSLETVLPATSFAVVLAWALAGLEICLALTLLFAPRGPARFAALGSGLLAIVFGVFVVSSEPQSCWCAGRVVAFDVVEHSLVVAALALLSGLAWRALDHGERALRARAVSGVAVAGAIALWLVWAPASNDDSHATAAADAGAATASPTSERPLLISPDPAKASDALTEGNGPTDETAGIHGFVVSATDASPVAGAIVLEQVDDDAVASRSGEDGSWSMQRAAGDRAVGVRLAAWAQGYLPYVAADAVIPTDAPIFIRLEQGKTISGKTIDQFARPLPDARVVAQGALAADFLETPVRVLGHGNVPRFGSATSNEDGEFRITGLAHGTYRLFVYPEGDVRSAMATGGVEVRAGEADVVLTVTVVDRLRVRAVDAKTGEVIPYADIQISIRKWDQKSLPHPDPAVRTELRAGSAYPFSGSTSIAMAARDADRPWTIEVTAQAVGYERKRVSAALRARDADAPLDVALSATDGLGVEMIPVTAVWSSGRVFDGILDLRVGSPANRRGWPQIPMAFRDGRAVGRLPVPRGSAVVEVRGMRGSPYGGPGVEQEIRLVPSDGIATPRHLDLVLKGAELRIRARAGEHGALLRRFLLNVGSRTSGGPQGEFGTEGGPFSLTRLVRERFSTGICLPPGKHHLTLRASGFEHVSRDVEVDGEEDLILWDVILRAAGEDG